jgi:hypothetical protein
MKNRTIVLGLCVSATLAACGGGSSPTEPAPVTLEVPESASRSTAGMVDYLARLTSASADDAEPLDVSRFAPPQPDDGEAAVLN